MQQFQLKELNKEAFSCAFAQFVLENIQTDVRL